MHSMWNSSGPDGRVVLGLRAAVDRLVGGGADFFVEGDEAQERIACVISKASSGR